jgi:hypothetical protein
LDRDPSSESLLPWRDKTYKWKPLIAFWTFRTGSAGGSKTCAPFTAILCSESSLLPIAEAGHMGLTSLQSPRQTVSSGKSFYRDARRLKASEPVIAKAVSDDVSRSTEPALPDGSCFRHFLCWFHHTLFILRSVRRGRMGALSMYQSPRYPYG